MKRLLALLLCALMVSMLAACSNKEDETAAPGEGDKIVTEITVNDDTFVFADVDSESVRITGFRTANDTAHEVVIPAYLDGKLVVEIGQQAFESLSSISKITFPTEADFLAGNADFVMAEYSLTIGNYAFRGCDNLREITIPAYVKSIGELAFYECVSLSSVTFTEGGLLNKIPKAAFAGCTALESVTVPGNVKVVDYGAFFECDGLQTVTLCDGVVEVGAQAFQKCEKLATVTLAASVTMVGNKALAGCTALTAVNYSGSSEQVLNYIDELNLPQ
ncbi:MAG: leucine-rich repeat protein [Clostridia bacterium]|nr:leucine-rich repeat protein [Clostridia bacterium]